MTSSAYVAPGIRCNACNARIERAAWTRRTATGHSSSRYQSFPGRDIRQCRPNGRSPGTDQLSERFPDPANRPHQDLLDSTRSDRVDQCQFSWSPILALFHRCRVVHEYMLDRPSALRCDPLQFVDLLICGKGAIRRGAGVNCNARHRCKIISQVSGRQRIPGFRSPSIQVQFMAV